MKIIASTLYLFVSFFLWIPVHSQTLLQQTVGSTGDERANSLAATADGGFIVAGSTDSVLGSKNSNLYILKYDQNGLIEWNKIFDSLYSGIKIIQTTDAGFAVLCEFENAILKLDASGNIQWFKRITGQYDAAPYDMIQTSDGGFAICGYDNTPSNNTSIDAYVAKISSTGVIQWVRTIGGYNWDVANSIIEMADQSYILVGQSNSFDSNGYYQVYIVSIDSSGNLLWSKTRSDNLASSGGIQTINTFDGGFAVIAKCQPSNIDFLLQKFDASGNCDWSKRLFLSSPSSWEVPHGVIQTADSGYMICGAVNDFGSVEGMVVTKADKNGDHLWSKVFGQGIHAWGKSIAMTADGNYIAVGYAYPGNSDEDILMAKLDINGFTCGNYDAHSGSSLPVNSIFNINGGVTSLPFDSLSSFNAGSATSGGGVLTFCNTLSVTAPETFNVICYPNPFSEKITLDLGQNAENATIEISDLHGRVRTYKTFSGRKCTVERNNLSPGVYGLRLSGDGGVFYFQKIIVID